MTIRSAVAKSTNAIAVRVVDELTPQAAYDFLTEQLDFKHLNSADIDLAPMALGGMNGGVTVREMAAGFSIFLNDGIFNGARTYTKVLNSDGTVLLENEPLERQVFEREQTVYYMRDVLKGVTSSAMAAQRAGSMCRVWMSAARRVHRRKSVTCGSVDLRHIMPVQHGLVTTAAMISAASAAIPR